MENREIAQQIIDNGRFIIPLLPNSKRNDDRDILTKKYPATDVGSNYNVGINLGLSNNYALDMDTKAAIHFAMKCCLKILQNILEFILMV